MDETLCSLIPLHYRQHKHLLPHPHLHNRCHCHHLLGFNKSEIIGRSPRHVKLVGLGSRVCEQVQDQGWKLGPKSGHTFLLQYSEERHEAQEKRDVLRTGTSRIRRCSCTYTILTKQGRYVDRMRLCSGHSSNGIRLRFSVSQHIFLSDCICLWTMYPSSPRALIVTRTHRQHGMWMLGNEHKGTSGSTNNELEKGKTTLIRIPHGVGEWETNKRQRKDLHIRRWPTQVTQFGHSVTRMGNACLRAQTRPSTVTMGNHLH